MSDGANVGVGPERALDTILGGADQPKEEDSKSPEWWLNYLVNEKDDNIDGYNEHAEVMAKYIILAYQAEPNLTKVPISAIYSKAYDKTFIPDIGEVLKQHIYTSPSHPFRLALSEATGFSFGWAVNIARFAMKLNQVPNPALITIG